VKPLQCPECRKAAEHPDGTIKAPRTGKMLIEATGRMRLRGHKRLPRRPYRQAEVIHTLCGHRWWSTHPQAIEQGDRLSGGMIE